jgi:hypothetical protein
MKINDSPVVPVVGNGLDARFSASFDTLLAFCKSQFNVLYVNQKEKYIDISNWNHAIDKNVLKNTVYSNVISQYVYSKIRFHWQQEGEIA